MLALDQVTAEDGPRVGNKALRLSELQQAGLRVPPSFVVTTEAYRAFAAANRLEEAADWADCFDQAELPGSVVDAVVEAYWALCDRLSPLSGEERSAHAGHLPLVVRSSATVEDLASNLKQFSTWCEPARFAAGLPVGTAR